MMHDFLMLFWSWYYLCQSLLNWLNVLMDELWFRPLNTSLLYKFLRNICSFNNSVYLHGLHGRRDGGCDDYFRRNNDVWLNWRWNYVWKLMILKVRHTHRSWKCWSKLNFWDEMLILMYKDRRESLSLIEVWVKNMIHSWTLKRGRELSSNWSCSNTVKHICLRCLSELDVIQYSDIVL